MLLIFRKRHLCIVLITFLTFCQILGSLFLQNRSDEEGKSFKALFLKTFSLDVSLNYDKLYKRFLQKQRSDFFIYAFYKLIFRIMSIIEEDIFFWFSPSVSFLQLEFHSSSPWGTLKTETPIFLLELEQQKIKQFAPPCLLHSLSFNSGTPWGNLKQNLGCLTCSKTLS